MDLAKIVVYKDAAGEWRWRIRATNGEIIAASTEGYKTKDDVEANIIMLADTLISGFQIVQDEEQ
jgi:uncharacterized protein YegP (UPF0339 family)